MTVNQRRWLVAHALVVGIGWFIVGLPVAIFAASNSSAAGSFWDSVPTALQGGMTVVAVVFAVPLLWPVWLAIGWVEGSVATQTFTVPRRSRLVSRLISAQAVGWLLLAAGVGVVARLPESDWYAQASVRSAWLLPALVGAGHAVTARVVGRSLVSA